MMCAHIIGATFAGYREVYVQAPKEVLIARNQKGLYSGVMDQTTRHVAGDGSHGRGAGHSDLVLYNDGSARRRNWRSRFYCIGHKEGEISAMGLTTQCSSVRGFTEACSISSTPRVSGESFFMERAFGGDNLADFPAVFGKTALLLRR